LSSLTWVDTRDMIADGLTKGSIVRDAFEKAIAGKLSLSHDSKSWTPRNRISSQARLGAADDYSLPEVPSYPSFPSSSSDRLVEAEVSSSARLVETNLYFVSNCRGEGSLVLHSDHVATIEG
jgi:hypothetical protein